MHVNSIKEHEMRKTVMDSQHAGKRLLWLDALKGILILLVVLGHAVQCAHRELGQEFTSDGLWRLIYSFHMPAFMAASGFVAFRGKGKACKTSAAWVAMAWRRFLQLVVPFLLWSIPLFFVKHDRPHLWDYVLWPNLSLWFLWALFFIAMLFSLLEWLASKWNCPAWSLDLGTAVLLLGLGAALPNSRLFGFEYVAWYFSFYFLGHATRQYALLERIPPVLPFLLLLLWLFLGSFWEVRSLPTVLSGVRGVPPVVLKLVYRLVTALFAVFSFFPLARNFLDRPGIPSRVFASLGQVSLGIYAVHMVIRYPLVAFLHALLPNLPYAPLMLLVFASLLPLSLLLVRLLSRFRLTSSLLLGKL